MYLLNWGISVESVTDGILRILMNPASGNMLNSFRN